MPLMPALLAITIGAVASAQEPASSKPSIQDAAAASPAGPSLAGEDERVIYSLGVSLWRALAPLELSPAEIEAVVRGLRDATSGTATLRPDEVEATVAAFRRRRSEKAAGQFRAASVTYLETAGKQAGAVTTASGLIFFELQPGIGASPKPSDVVRVHYRGTLVDGKEFDSSYARRQPVQLPLDHLVPCWIEGLQLMKVGGKARFVCPARLGYGDAGAPTRDRRKPSIPGGATLVFDVELFGIMPTPLPR